MSAACNDALKTPAAFVHSNGRVEERDVELRPMPMDPASVADRETIVHRAQTRKIGS